MAAPDAPFIPVWQGTYAALPETPQQTEAVLRDRPDGGRLPSVPTGTAFDCVFPYYPALLLIPAWRNRSDGAVGVLIDHIIYGVGILAELVT